MNEKAFGLDSSTRELATKTLTEAEKQDPGLDILSGFIILDGITRIVAERVLADGAIEYRVEYRRSEERTWLRADNEAEYHKYPSNGPNWASIAAAPSRYPPRRFCTVTGLAGKYKCPVTGDYLATLDAYGTHRETRLKGIV